MARPVQSVIGRPSCWRSPLKDSLLNTWANCRGWRSKRQLVVFESDDWGATRLRDTSAYESMLRAGMDLSCSRYDRLDCLESRRDLNALFGIIDSHRCRAGRPPVFTFNAAMGNPDFAAIRATDFEKFVHEDLFRTYVRHHGDDLQPVWRDAISKSLIKPQFHAREHLNIGLWLQDLRDDFGDVRLAFDHEYYGQTTVTSSPRQRHYLAAYWPESAEHLEEIQAIADDGLTMFEDLFGFPSRSFVACNYVWPNALEQTLATKGVELIQCQRGQLIPSSDGQNVSVRRCYTGQRNEQNQAYSVRNVKFEPVEDRTADWVGSAMNGISQAFFWGKPAVISTHRINYVGGIDSVHRDNSLRLLNSLLREMLVRWPDIEFVSSDQLFKIVSA